MRIRTVKPEFHQHEGLAQLPREDRLLAVALLNWSDDHGYFRSHPALIAGSLFPFDADGHAFVTRGMAHLAEVGFLKLYEGGVGHIVKFGKHQVINKPAKSRLQDKATIEVEGARRTPVVLPEESGVLPEGSHREVEQGTGNREVEKEVEVERAAVEKPPAGLLPPAEDPPDKFASSEAFEQWFQFKRGEVGLVREKASNGRTRGIWWNEVHVALNGDLRPLEPAVLKGFAEDKHWQQAKPPLPFNAFMSEWRKYVPQKRAA